MVDVGAILLAAGSALRFRAAGGGSSKLVSSLAGKPLVRHAAEAALRSRARPVVVVTGSDRAEVAAALDGLALRLAHNADYASGLASSLKVGIAALPTGADAALVLLGDMPGVTAALIDSLIGAFEARPDALAAAPTSGSRRGNPVLLSRVLFAAIEGLEGDEGARRLLAEAPAGRVIEVAAAGEGAILDVDTPAALEEARRTFER